jgi:ribosome-associated protein
VRIIADAADKPATDTAAVDTAAAEGADRVLQIVERSLEDDKAIDPVVISLAGKTNIADYMVVATGTSQRHLASMAEKLRDRLKGEGPRDLTIEGVEQGGSPWILIDAGDVIVHLFRAETRAFYDIEKLWSVAVPRRAAAAAEAAG